MRNIENFLSYTPVGLYCAAGDFYVDPKRAVHKALISHAHSDHAVPNSGNIYTTRSTRMLMLSRYRNAMRSRFHELRFRERFTLGEVDITFFPAGHILGSSQILLEHAGVRYLYTGDFKLQADASCEEIEFVKADVLITETTFANPDYSHPEPWEEISRLNEVKEIPVMIGAYSIGKAQRLTHLLAEHVKEKKIFVHSEIARFHDVYESEGWKLGEWHPYSRQEFKEEGNGVYIVPPRWLSRNSRNKKVFKAFATGWKRYFYQCDAILHISDHADWNGVLEMINKVGPRKIFTLHGDGSYLKKHLEGSSFEVTVLNSRSG